MPTKVLLTIIALAYITMMVLTFKHNLPAWCAKPSGHGNWMVQPFCPTK